MKKRLYYEVKKVYFSKCVVVLFVFFTLFLFAFGIFSPKNTNNTITNDRYIAILDSVIYQAEITLELTEDKHSETALYQQEIIDRYTTLQKQNIEYSVSGYDILIASPLPFFCAFIFVVWLTLRDSMDERKSQVLYLSYKQKRVGIGGFKITLLLISTFLFTAFFTLVFALGVGVKYDFCGIFAPIQSIFSYILCPYDLPIATLLLLRVTLASLMTACFCLVVYLFSLIFSKWIPLLLSVILLISGDFLAVKLTENIAFSFVQNCNLVALLTDTWMLRLNGFKFGKFLSQVEIALYLLPLLLLIFSVIYLIFLRYTRTVKTIRNKHRKTISKTEKTHSIFLYECKKILHGKAVLITICLLICSLIFTYMQIDVPTSVFDEIYKEYLVEMKELSFEDQQLFVSTKKAVAHALIREDSIAEQKFNRDEMDFDTYLDIHGRAGVAELQLEVLSLIDKQLVKIEILRNKGINAVLSYAIGWEELFSLSWDPFWLLALIFLLIPYVMIEKSSHFDRLLNPYFLNHRKEQRKFERKKIICMLMVGLIVTMLFMTLQILLIHFLIGLPSWNSYAITIISNDFMMFRYYQLVLVRFVVYFLISCLLTIFVFFSSYKKKKMI